MALVCAALVAGCGGGGSADVVVVGGQPPVAYLDVALTRVGVQAVRVDWSDDRYVATFRVRRDGYTLGDVQAVTLIDASVFLFERYCYDVLGYDASGVLVAASDVACITVAP